jgi:hypothetical protein
MSESGAAQDPLNSRPKPLQSTPASIITSMAASNAGRIPTGKDSLGRGPSSPGLPHRQSFAENLRGIPPSPRAHRQPSLTQQALQDLVNNPPVRKKESLEFGGREWKKIGVGEVVERHKIKWVEVHTSVEDATNVNASCSWLTRYQRLVLIHDLASHI